MISRVCVLGLGVIGLPTALHISKFYEVEGYDINPKAVEKASKMGAIRKDFHGQYHKEIFIIPLYDKEQLIHELTMAIATYQAEEIEKEMKKFRETNRKAKE